MKKNDLKTLVILGGGTAGRIAAAALARNLDPARYRITVIESSHIASIGLGESVLPSLVSFIRQLGVDEEDFIRKTGASIKLGTEFRNWSEDESTFFNPLGSPGREFAGHDFFSCWQKACAQGDTASLQDYMPAALMADRRKFDFPSGFQPGSPLLTAKYALHLDAVLVCRYLREYAQEQKVEYIKAHVVRVNLDEGGSVKSVELNNRETVEGDFFLDCSGHRGLLIHEALHSAYESWSHLLPCDRAVAIQTSSSEVASLYTVATAMQNGWVWRIPMHGRVSHGYVFASEHASDNQAIRVLLDAAGSEPLQEPRFIPFRSGLRKELWKKNCIALGLAAGFLEPLASTAIHLAIRGVECMLDLFPNLDDAQGGWSVLAAEYNRRLRVEYEEARDFIILHYCTSKRADTEFWRRCQSRSVPESVIANIELFKYRGELQVGDGGLFSRLSWQLVLTGMGVIPRHWHPFIDDVDFNEMHRRMQNARADLGDAVHRLPQFENFIQRIFDGAGE